MRSIVIKTLALAAILLLAWGSGLTDIPVARAVAGAPYTDQRVGWAYGITGLNETAGQANTDDQIYTINWRSQAIRFFPRGNFTHLRIYVGKTGAPTNLLVSLYSNGGDEKPSSQLALWNFTTASISVGWNNLTLSPPYKIPSLGKYHIVLRQTGGSSANYWMWYKLAAGTYQGTGYCKESSSDSGASWVFTTASDYSFDIYYTRINQITTTSDSDSFGSGASTQFRFNFTYAFPTGSSVRALNVTYPLLSYRVNVTTTGGSLISSSSYSDSSYNGTHRIVGIPEAVISVSGNSYSLFTHRWAAVYFFRGLFYENGTYKNSVSLSMANSSGSWSYTLSHTLIVGTSSIPDAFYWPIGSYTRYIAPLEAQENFTITYPDGYVAGYSFMIRDFIGITAGQDCYLESSRTVNGSIQLIERILITTTINGVPLSLTQNRIYIIEIYDSSMDVGHEFGYFMPTGYNLEPSLTLQEMAFTDQAQMVSQYVRTEAQREDPYTSIIVIYNNTLSSEYNADANLLVKKRDGTLVYNSTTSDDAHTWTVPGLTNTTDYIIFLTVTHDFWGTLKWNKVLSGAHTFLSPPDLGVLGTWGGIPSGNILSAGLILLVAGLFSFLSAGLGIFVVVVLSAGLIRLGWISSVSSGIIIVCLGLAIMLAMSQRLRR